MKCIWKVFFLAQRCTSLILRRVWRFHSWIICCEQRRRKGDKTKRDKTRQKVRNRVHRHSFCVAVFTVIASNKVPFYLPFYHFHCFFCWFIFPFVSKSKSILLQISIFQLNWHTISCVLSLQKRQHQNYCASFTFQRTKSTKTYQTRRKNIYPVL